MRGRIGLAPRLGVLILALSLLWLGSPEAPEARAQLATSSLFFTLEQGGFSTTLRPIRGTLDVASFYNYTNFQSNLGFEVVGRSLLFLYLDETTGEYSLVIVHSRADGGAGSVTFTFEGLPPGAQFQVQDDPDDQWTLDPTAGTAEVSWTWQAGYNDGAAGGAPHPGLRLEPGGARGRGARHLRRAGLAPGARPHDRPLRVGLRWRRDL